MVANFECCRNNQGIYIYIGFLSDDSFPLVGFWWKSWTCVEENWGFSIDFFGGGGGLGTQIIGSL